MQNDLNRLSETFWDVVVVGGGLAGCSLGLALKDSSKKIALLDAKAMLNKEFPQADKIDKRSLGLSETSRQILQSLGVWGEFAEQVNAIDTIHVSQKGSLGVARIHAQDEGMEALGWVVPYTALQKSLQNKLISEPSIDFFAPAVVQEIDQKEKDYVGLCAQYQGKEVWIKARWAILAEGGGGKLLQAANFTSNKLDYHQSAIVTHIRTEKSNVSGHTAYERFTQHGPLAVLPHKNGDYGVVWVHPNCQTTRKTRPLAQEILSWNEGSLIAGIQEDIGQRIGKITQIDKPVCFPLTRSKTTRMYQGRVIAIGNAAHTVHPIAAQGFNLSLRDISFLAECFMESGSSAQLHTALCTWEKERQQDINNVLSLTHFLACAPMIPVGHLFSGQFILMFEMFPWLRRLLIRRSLGLSPPQSRLASGLPLNRF